MNWEELFSMQKSLDLYIKENNKLNDKELFSHKYLALLVELGELANETRCFKFWSSKSKGNRDDILEEYVDGIHFILSLGIEKGLNFSTEDLDKTSLKTDHSETEKFNKVFEAAVNFNSQPTQDNYHLLFKQYLQLGRLLGFHEVDIQQAYYEKNKVNYERQLQGY